MASMQYCRFAVDEKPFCVWEWDLDERNRRFLDGLDPGYFRYLAETYLATMEGGDARRAALALRTAHQHAIESLMALIFAAFQAPGCVPGWLHRFGLSDLRNLIARVRDHRPFLSYVPLQEPGWHGIAQEVLRFVRLEDGEKEARITQGFAGAWTRFAADFLDEKAGFEYNSVKHGFRVRSGGFRIAIGVEETPGAPAPPGKMRVIGESDHGSTFFIPERIGNSNTHFRLRTVSRNWLPRNLGHALVLIEMSMRNVISFARIVNGADPTTVKFVWPAAEEDPFWLPWSESPGVTHTSLDTVITEEDIKPFTEQEILSVYDEADGGAAPSAPAVTPRS